MGCTVAVVGATGLVGRAMLSILAERAFPADRVLALASPRSVGRKVAFAGEELEVLEANGANFEGVDVALFSAGAGPSRELAPIAAERGAVVIDNSSAWRMDPEVPLVVPEVNPSAAFERPKGIIANPNCSTIQLVVALKPLYDLARIEHIVVSTYQAASGKGQAAVDDLEAQQRQLAEGRRPVASVFPGPLAGNLLCDWKAGAGDYSEEELKMVNETRKILGDAALGVSPTTVRVPVMTGHSESVFVKFSRKVSVEDAKEALRHAPGVSLMDEPYAPGRHPQPIDCAGRDEVFVGRVRADLAVPEALNLWVVSDNLRKGAALNAVQIAELLRQGTR